ncbi:MAG: MFS transporter [Sphingomonadales bacterium]|nr:MFS transporter [Sphingomonadales bacterium]
MTETEKKALPSRWLVLFLLLLIFIFNYADRFLISGLVGTIKAEFGLGDSFMGLLMGPAFVVLYVLAGIPIARLADRRSRGVIIAVGCLVWSLFTGMTGLAVGPLSLAFCRVGVGIGEAALLAPAYSLLSDYFPPEKRGVAFSILGLGTYFSQIGGYAVGPAIANSFGWQTAFFAMGARNRPRHNCAFCPARTLQQNPWGDSGKPHRHCSSHGWDQKLSHSDDRNGTRHALRCLVRVLGSDLVRPQSWCERSRCKQCVCSIFRAVRAYRNAHFRSHLGQAGSQGPAGPPKLAAASLFAATLCILFVTWSDDFAKSKLLAIPSGLLGGGWSVGVMASLQFLLPDRYRATATASFVAVTTLIGLLAGPWLAGTVSELFGDAEYSLRLGLSVTIPAGFVAAVFLWSSARNLAGERNKLAALES